jgi:hypothetical protein
MMVSINGDTQSWMVYDGLLRENSIKIDDLEVHPFQETSILFIYCLHCKKWDNDGCVMEISHPEYLNW